MNILAIIPARGGSKRIPRKNIAPVNGKPLVSYTINAALNSEKLDRVIVSTDDQEIETVSQELGADVIRRPSKLATDGTTSLAVVQHVLLTLEDTLDRTPQVVVLLQPTSPLRTSLHIDEALNLFLSDGKAESLVSVVEVPHIFQPEKLLIRQNGFVSSLLTDKESSILKSKNNKYFVRNGAAIYITTHRCLIEKNSFFGKKVLCYEMDPEDSIDINQQWELELCELILQLRESKQL